MAKTKKPLHDRDFENMEEEDILSQIKKDMQASVNFQAPYFKKFKEYYKLYRSYIAKEDMNEYRSNLFIPRCFELVETVTPKIVNSIFASRPYVQTIPLGVADNKIRTQRANKMNKLLDYQMQQRIKMLPISADIIKSMLINGTAISKQTWDFKEKQIVKKKPLVINGIDTGDTQNVLVQSVVRDDPMVTLVSILDFFFDPSSIDIPDSRYCVHRFWEDLSTIKEKAKKAPSMYKNLDKLDKSSGSSFADSGKSQLLSAVGNSAEQGNAKGIKIWEYWTDDWVVQVANEDTIIYSGMNPYFHREKPFAKWVDCSVPNEFYGIGQIEAVEQLQYELNAVRNQRIDNVSMAINKMWKIKRSASIDTKQLISRPAGFVEVDENDDIEELKTTDVTSSAYNEENIVKNDMDRTVGVHDTERGSSPTRRETATTMNILANAAGDRFKLKKALTEEGGFRDMVRQLIALNQQYVDTARELMLIGNDGTMEMDVITPEEIMGGWTILAVGSSSIPAANREAKQQQLTQLYSIVKDRQDINHQQLLKAIFESFELRDIDTLFVQQPPPMTDPNAMMQGAALPGTTAPMPTNPAELV